MLRPQCQAPAAKVRNRGNTLELAVLHMARTAAVCPAAQQDIAGLKLERTPHAELRNVEALPTATPDQAFSAN